MKLHFNNKCSIKKDISENSDNNNKFTNDYL